MKEIQLGLVPDLGGTLPLRQAVGYQRALEICLTGRKVTGTEAAELGMALACVEDDELSGATDDLVAAIVAAMPNATTAVLELLQGCRRPHAGRADGGGAAGAVRPHHRAPPR